MRATVYNRIVLLSCLPSVSIAASVPFSNDICPSWYLRRGEYDNRQGPVFELIATCSTGNSGSHEYITSSLDIDPCFTNHDGNLEPAVSGTSNQPGKFSRTCGGCGLDLEGPSGNDKKTWNVVMRCLCDKNPGFNYGNVQISRGINVNNGILGCMNYPGSVVQYSPSANPVMLPPPGTTTATMTATFNRTITNTITATSNATFFSTATDTAITTVISSCPSPSQVTVTKTRKGKAHKVTTTAIKTETHPVTILVSIMVTETPTPKPTIAAQLHSTVVADFSTIN